jgi:hypothetical protein
MLRRLERRVRDLGSEVSELLGIVSEHLQSAEISECIQTQKSSPTCISLVLSTSSSVCSSGSMFRAVKFACQSG